MVTRVTLITIQKEVCSKRVGSSKWFLLCDSSEIYTYNKDNLKIQLLIFTFYLISLYAGTEDIQT